MDKVLRVAFFPDSFLEVDGVAMTSNRLVNFAKERNYPLICVHAGPRTEAKNEGSIRYLSLKRSPLAIPMDETLSYDPLFQRHVVIDRHIVLDPAPVSDRDAVADEDILPKHDV